MELKQILQSDDKKLIKSLFIFNSSHSEKEILFKFNLWSRYFFPKYFTSEDAPFHKDIDLYNLHSYQGKLTTFVDIAFRGGAKTVRTKLFIAYCVANDEDLTKRYIKVLTSDTDNGSQIVTDIYNILINTKGFYS
jgi:hypothetical protein